MTRRLVALAAAVPVVYTWYGFVVAARRTSIMVREATIYLDETYPKGTP